ncbi:PAS domain S-box protein [Ferrimonas marina]|uniref:Sensory/regulatory protein RpfC n=1 Tax=Ferrimonas marina TaxID=299255 RepID=A0A1M5VRL8_9GAMM|nr:PAS domain S-box protein [Ferrimonas marina]SHH77563.1 PAS domain S-box-containing protein [Ferrimonas marina]
MNKSATPPPLRRQVVWQLVLPMVFLLALGMGINLYLEQKRWYADVNDELEEELILAVERLDSLLDNVSQTINLTVTHLKTQSLPGDERLYRLTRQHLNNDPDIYGSAIALEPSLYGRRFAPYSWQDQNGRHSMDIAANAYDYTDGSWDWWELPRTTNKAVWTPAYFDENAGNVLMTTYSAPIYIDGVFNGVVTADLELENLADRLQMSSSELMVADKQGRLIAHERTEMILTAEIGDLLADTEENRQLRSETDTLKSGFRRLKLANGSYLVLAYRRMPVTDWLVVLFRPAAVVDAPIYAEYRRVLMQLVTFSLLFALITWLLGNRLLSPLQQLRERVGQLQRGGCDMTPLANPGTEELQALDHALLAMADTLAEREKRLQDAHGTRLAGLLEGMGDGAFYFSMDAEGCLIRVSDSVQSALGYEPEIFCHKFARLLTDNPANEANWRYQRQVLAGEPVPPHPLELRHQDGRVRQFNVYLQPIRDEQDQVIGAEAMLTDISDEVEAGRWYQSIIEAAPDAILLVEPEGRIVYLNEQAEKLTGYDKQELLGQAVEILLPKGFRGHHPTLRQRFTQDSHPRPMGLNKDLSLLRKDGLELAVEISLSQLPEVPGRKRKISAIIRDITARKRSELALKQAKRQLEAITESVPGVVFQVVIEGPPSGPRCTFISAGITAALGLTQQQVLEDIRSLFNQVHPDDRSILRNALKESLNPHQDWRSEMRIAPIGGDYRWFVIGARSDEAASGLPRWTGFMVDITEQKAMAKQLEASEAHFRALFDNAGIGIVTLSDKGVINAMNERFTQFAARDEQQLVGQHISLLLPGEERDHFATEIEPLLSGERRHLAKELRYRKADGELRWADIRLVRLGTSSPETALVLTMSDITERRQVNEALKQAKSAADTASQAKSDFLANMSHEIRTPMNAIIGMTQLCMQTELQPRQADYLSKIHSASQTLLGLLNDVLDYSKIEAGKLELEHTDFTLDSVLEQLSDLFAAKANDKALELLFAIDPKVPKKLRGDPLRLGQVLTNLVANALKFTEQGEVVLSVNQIAQAKEQTTLCFSVRDTGIGMTQEQQDRLFHSFSQADTSTTRKYGGTGLGLAISQHLVKLMGGEIQVDSAPGVGSAFQFTVPLGRIREAEVVPLLELDNLPLLLVDDNDTSLEVLERTLSSFGFLVYRARSGQQALSQLEVMEPPELVLCDYRMPQMDGLELAQRLIDWGMAPERILMLTAYSDETLHQRTDKMGLAGFLTKPTNPSRLLDKVLTMLGHQGQVRPIRRQTSLTLSQAQLDQLRGKRILLVEDNPINQEVACEFLEQLGLTVHVAEHGKLALEKLQQSQYDLVLMDCQMPVMDGYEATRRIRHDLKLSLPIIAMTANAMQGDREKCLAAGMDDHLAKPIDINHMHQTLWHYLGDDSPLIPVEAPVEPPVARWPHHPLLDVDKGLQLVQGSEKLYRRLLIRFAESQKESMNNLQLHSQRQQWSQAQRLAHTLKGLCGSLASPELVADFARLEQAFEEHRKAPKLLLKASDKMAQVLDAIEQWQPNPESAEPLADDALKSALRKLQPLLERYDPEAAEQVEALALTHHPQAGDLRELAKLIKGYQFDQARAWLARHLGDEPEGGSSSAAEGADE